MATLPRFFRAIPWRRIARWTALGLSVAGVASLGGYVAFGPHFRVARVQVERRGESLGPSHISAAELRHLADIRLGTPMLTVWTSEAVQGVLAHPWVRTANVSRRFPDTILVQYEEQEPVLLLQYRGLHYVNAEGWIFKKASNDDLDYPVLTGIDPDLGEHQGDTARQILEQALVMLQAVDASAELDRRDISEVHFNRWDGFDLVLRSGSELAFGFADPADRLNRLADMRRHGMDPRVPQRVDLSSERLAVATPYAPPSPPSPRPAPALSAAPLAD